MARIPGYYYEKIAPENKLLSLLKLKSTSRYDCRFYGRSRLYEKNDYNEDRFMFTQFYIGTKSDIEQAQEQTEKVDFVPSILKQAE